MGVLNDLRFGLRMLIKNPAFSALAVVTLALGIGINSTIFTLVNGVFLKGLPFDNPHEIVGINSAVRARGMDRAPVSYLDFLDFRDRTRSFQDIGAFAGLQADLSDDQAAAERVTAASISANTFSLLGQQPILGRDFTEADEKIGSPAVALLSYGLWQSRYGGNPSILGSTIRINLQQHTIVGIMPDREAFPNGARLWVPLVPDDSRSLRDQRNIEVFGRLAPDTTVARAGAELQTIAAALAQSYPDTNKDIEVLVYPFIERNNGGPIRTIFFAMQGAVSFVLLIACANVANLLLSRALRRTRETSIRSALGASRWRIVRQLLVESVLLSFIGGILGLGLAVLGVRLFWNAVADTNPPYWLDFSMDYRVFIFFFLVCLGTGVVFGLAPALQVSRTNVNENLRDGGRGSSTGIRARRLTGALIVAEIALTIVLLVGAGLMMRSFINIQRIDVGISTENLLLGGVTLRPPKYPEAAQRYAFQQVLLERLQSLPGIEAVALASQAPANGAIMGPFRLADREVPVSGSEPASVARIAIAPGYFKALGRDVILGREFGTEDGAPGAEVVIVNETFASTHWPGESPIGRRIQLGESTETPWLTVVGVSPVILQQSTNNVLSPRPTVYVPYRQEPVLTLNIIVRSRLATESTASAVRNELRTLDADLPFFNIRTLEDSLRQRIWPYQVFGTLFTIFAGIAMLMSAVGLYGVTAYGVGQRTQEIGIRMALGASSRDVLWLVLRQGIMRILIGVSLGLVAAWGMSRVLAGLLVDITASDPLTFLAISLLLAAITLIACVVPARRAMALDPGDALRVG